MKIIPFIALFLLAICESPIAQTMLTLQPNEISPTIGSEIEVSFNTTGFTDINAIQFSLSWDPSVVELSSPVEVCENLLPGTPPLINEVVPGTMVFAWFDMAGAMATFLDGTSAFKIKWTATGEGDANFQISDRPLGVEISTLMGPITDASVDASAIQTIEVQSGIPTMSQWALFILCLVICCCGLVTIQNSRPHLLS